MGVKVLKSLSHDPQKADLLCDGAGDGFNVPYRGTQQAGI